MTAIWHTGCRKAMRTMGTQHYSIFIMDSSGCGQTLLFQGASPEKWMLEAGEYTMNRFAKLYGFEYAGMATNQKEAEKLGKSI